MSRTSATLAVFIPTLDESPSAVVATAKLLEQALRRRLGRTTEILVYDAGSRATRIQQLKQALAGSSLTYRLLGAGSSLRPNKNLGIAYAFAATPADSLLCVDADLLRPNDVGTAEAIAQAVLDNEAGLTVPAVHLELGRLNRLVVRPLLEAAWPGLATQLPVPLSGIYCLPATIGKRSVEAPTYRYHFGGELSLLLACYRAELRIAAPQLPLTATRHRATIAKAQAAKHLLSSGIEEGLFEGPPTDPGRQANFLSAALTELLDVASAEDAVRRVNEVALNRRFDVLVRPGVSRDWEAPAELLKQMLIRPLAELLNSPAPPPTTEVAARSLVTQAAAVQAAAPLATLVLSALAGTLQYHDLVPVAAEGYMVGPEAAGVDLLACTPKQLDEYSSIHAAGAMQELRRATSLPDFGE